MIIKKKKIWNRIYQEWIDGDDIWLDADEDGYCSCPVCQHQKKVSGAIKAHQVEEKLPDDLFELE